ncbi:MAG: CDP-glucose 4,6-dehydratase [Rhizomicrobium sp.]
MIPSIWVGKRVFLTGHTGFKGSWLTLMLRRLGAQVAGYALSPPTEPNLFSVARVGEDVISQISDIRDGNALRTAIGDFSPDVVFHLAAQPLVRASYALPVETYETNVMGTIHLLEAVRQTPSVKATVIVTSDKCYDNRETIWAYRENDAMGGYDPYSSSKGCAELVTASYGRSYFQPSMGKSSIVSVRAGNVIGGGDWADDRLMADLARALLANRAITIRSPEAVRPWQHVLEPLSGYLMAAEKILTDGPAPWTAWNFGPDTESEQTVGALAQCTCRAWGRPDALEVAQDPNAVHEAGLLKLDSTKARTYLGWRPRWNFEEAVTHAVAWYRAYPDGADMRAYTLAQIEAYEIAGKNTERGLNMRGYRT